MTNSAMFEEQNKPEAIKQTSDSGLNTKGTSDESIESVESNEIPVHQWLGGEPNLLNIKVEEKGIQQILGSLSDEEMAVIYRDTTMPIRFFRAEKGNVEKATERIKATIKWSEEVGLERIKTCFEEGGDQEIRKNMTLENETGYWYVRGYDAEGRAIIHLNPCARKTGNELTQFQFSIWIACKAAACTAKKSAEMNNGIPKEKFILVADYTHYQRKDRLPISVLKKIFHALNDHFPERLGFFYLINPPMVFRAIYSVVKHFVDPVTREKIVLCTGEKGLQKFTRRVKDLHKIEKFAGGTDDLRPFDFNEYINLPFDEAFDE